MHLLDYLHRIGHRRGFGIQSPWAYQFVREVIAEEWPYYAYEEIDREIDSKRERRRAKLLFRLANRIQPAVITDLTADIMGRQMLRACPSAQWLMALGGTDEPKRGIIRMPMAMANDAFLDDIPQRLTTDSALVLEDLSHDGDTQRHWQRIRQHRNIGITFDVGYAAFCFLDPTMYKQHYHLNA